MDALVKFEAGTEEAAAVPGRASIEAVWNRQRSIEIAFVNNMPDAAVKATFDQFKGIIEAAAADRVPFHLRCYTLPGIPRCEEMRSYLQETHEDIGALYSRGADALIVTGTEPRAPSLSDEPYWPELARLVSWARCHTFSAIWSCLAAHAAVQCLDGIFRRPSKEKISGIYSFNTTRDDWAMRGTGPSILVPHSRYNGLPREELESAGYTISSFSDLAGVDAFWRAEPSVFLFLQGHPEYSGDTLSREYRRDVIRYLNGVRDTYPGEPFCYFSAPASARLEIMKANALAKHPCNLESVLNEILSNETFEKKWSPSAIALYRNWLSLIFEQVSARQQERPSLGNDQFDRVSSGL